MLCHGSITRSAITHAQRLPGTGPRPPVSKQRMRKAGLALLVVSVGCASAPINKLDVAALAQADARIREGCYDCLLERAVELE